MWVPEFDISDDENPSRRRLYVVLFEIFSCGVQDVSKKTMALVSVWAAILEIPMLLMAVAFKFVDLAIILVAWWIFRNQPGAFAALADVLVTVALLVIFFKDLRKFVLKVLGYLFNAVTVGEIFKAICEGRREGVLKSEYVFKSEIFQDMIGVYANILPNPYRNEYEQLISLYSVTNDRKYGKVHRKTLDGIVGYIINNGYTPGCVQDLDDNEISAYQNS